MVTEMVAEPVRRMSLSSTTTSWWTLDRMNQLAAPRDGRIPRFGNDGSGVRIAIFDTGIRWTHADLTGRVAVAM